MSEISSQNILILLCLFPILVVGFSDKINDEINPNINMLTNGFLFLYSLITGLSNPNFLSFCTFMVFFWIFIHLAKLDNKKLEFKIKIFLILKFLITSLIFSIFFFIFDKDIFEIYPLISILIISVIEVLFFVFYLYNEYSIYSKNYFSMFYVLIIYSMFYLFNGFDYILFIYLLWFSFLLYFYYKSKNIVYTIILNLTCQFFIYLLWIF